MCGITGALALNHTTIRVDDAKPMTDILAHRGPDDAGYLFFHTACRHKKNAPFSLNLTDDTFKSRSEVLPSINSSAAQKELATHDWDLFLGHRRLSILDLSPAGHQPMSDLTGNVWIVYNGEIYNFNELKAKLQQRGYSFRSHTDTEVILYAYIEWGIACVEQFNGMFAFALYDSAARKFYLARDRYGIKPLYYTVTEASDDRRTLVFASEVKSILRYGDYEKGIDYEALVEYFTFQNIFSDRTLYREVKLLPPGHFITIDIADTPALNDVASIPRTQYWDFHFQEAATHRTNRSAWRNLTASFYRRFNGSWSATWR